jgi:hypothetical protein
MSERTASRLAGAAYHVISVSFWVGVGAAVLIMVGIWMLSDTGSLSVSAEMRPSVAAPPSVRCPDDCHVRSDGDQPVQVVFDDAGPAQKGPISAGFALSATATLAVVWQLRGLLASVREGNPFRSRNVRRLRTLGLLFLVGPPAVELISKLLVSSLVDAVPFVHLDYDLVRFDALLSSLCLFVLAEVFAYGTRLRDDVEATI